MVATLGSPLDAPIEHETDINHIVCCKDENVAFCGEDMSDASWVVDGAAVFCLPCREVDRQSTECPFGRKCPE